MPLLAVPWQAFFPPLEMVLENSTLASAWLSRTTRTIPPLPAISHATILYLRFRHSLTQLTSKTASQRQLLCRMLVSSSWISSRTVALPNSFSLLIIVFQTMLSSQALLQTSALRLPLLGPISLWYRTCLATLQRSQMAQRVFSASCWESTQSPRSTTNSGPSFRWSVLAREVMSLAMLTINWLVTSSPTSFFLSSTTRLLM